MNSGTNRQEKEQTEMVQIAESRKMKEAIEELLKEIDPQALTPEGKIQSYEIDKKKLKFNPMGGLMIELVLNKNDELTLNTTVQEDSDTGKYEVMYRVESEELSKLLKGD